MPLSPRAARIEEVPIWLEVNSHLASQWSATPFAVEALAAGRLLTLGYIHRREDIEFMDVVHDEPAGTIGVRVRIADSALERGLEHARHRRESRQGALSVLSRDWPTREAPSSALPEAADVAHLLRELFERAEARRGERGGMHAAALCEGGALKWINEDAGRHNTVDRAVGAGLLAGARLPSHGLVISARISGEIAASALMAGVPWVVSRSIATTLAIAIAGGGGLPMLGRGASAQPVEYGLP
jgi:FdhD protein